MRSANRNQVLSLAQRHGRNFAALCRAVDNTLEPLEARRLLSVSAVSAGGVLTVRGDNNANSITVSRDAAGNLLVNNGAVTIHGRPATIASIRSIDVFGFAGNDNIVLDETNGALPSASLFGGADNDTIAGGSGNDALFGQAGNDSLLGKGGNDVLVGGRDNDSLIGGAGTDQAFGEAGDDRMIWNPGDGSDLNEGGSGNDTVEVNGGNVSEAFSASSAGARVLFQRISALPFTLDIGSSENLVLNANGGDDSFTGGTGLAKLMSFSIDGGAGNDTLLGTDGADRLIGGDGNDLIDGNGGADIALLGAGDDVFKWDPGDGSDIVEGQGGDDTLLFNGSNANENIDLSANGSRLRFFRDAGNITMDVNDVQTVQFNALGGADNVTINDLSATSVTQVNVNLASSTGVGDGQVDSVIVNGTKSDDVFAVAGSAANGVSVNGPAAAIDITGAEPTDKLTINGLAGDDSIDASALDANVISFTANGGDGDDALIGSAGQDRLDGGAGDNVVVQ